MPNHAEPRPSGGDAILRATNWALWVWLGFVLSVVLARIWIDVGRYSLWIDEFFTLSLAYLSPDAPIRWAQQVPVGLLRWMAVLSSGYDPHFPTLYVLTRILSSLAPEGTPLDYFVRGPAVFLVSTLLLLTAAWCVRGGRREDVLLALLTVAALVGYAAWREHAAEARMYAIMSALGVAVVVAVYLDRPLAAAWLGLGLVLMHPFGTMIGFVPAAMALASRNAGPGRSARLALLSGFVVAASLAGGWLLLKFVLRASSGFSATGGGGDILGVVRGLEWPACMLAAVGVVACLVICRDARQRAAAWVYAALLLSALAAVATLVVLRPATPAYARYVTWLNPVLLCIAAACLCMILRCWAGRPAAALVAVAGLLAGGFAVVTALREPFGPPWGSGLREAAAHLQGVDAARAVVTHNTAEILDLPPRFRTSYRCFRAGQLVAYLDVALRERMPCQDDGKVAFPLEADQVFVVREPIAWVGPRRLLLDGFDLTDVVTFGATSVERHERRLHSVPGQTGSEQALPIEATPRPR